MNETNNIDLRMSEFSAIFEMASSSLDRIETKLGMNRSVTCTKKPASGANPKQANFELNT